MNNIKKYDNFINENSDENMPFKIGMKVDMVKHDGRAGKLIFYCENDTIQIEVAPGGGAGIVWNGEIDDIIDSKITKIRQDTYGIDLSFDNANDLQMEDDTGGEGLEAWIDLRHPPLRR